jgi:DNA polymerase elongation subunit (family B)
MANEFYTTISRFGRHLLYRGYKDGLRVHKRIEYSPHLYMKSAKGEARALDGARVGRIDFKTMSEATQYVKSYSDIDNHEIYGNTDYIAQFVQEKFPGDRIEFNADMVNTVFIDIEVYSTEGFPMPEDAAYPIDAVTVKSSKSSDYFVFTTVDSPVEMEPLLEKGIERTEIRLKYYETEEELLRALLRWWNEPHCTPDILTGWNVEGFDVPYLINRCRKLLGDDKTREFSPWKMIDEREVTLRGRKTIIHELKGIAILDYLKAFQKFGYSYGTQESYKLDHIASVVLGESKLSYDEYTGLHGLRDNDPARYLAYNIKDTWLVQQFEDKTGLINLIMTTAYKAGVNYSDCFGTTKIWDTIIYRKLAQQGIVVPPKKHNIKSQFAGGYVKAPHVGMHDWVVSYDLNSLYPNIIVQWNMSPETIVDERWGPLDPDQCLEDDFKFRDEYPEYSVAANGAQFKKDKQGIIPEIIVDYYAERKEVKKQMIATQQEKERVQEEIRRRKAQRA